MITFLTPNITAHGRETVPGGLPMAAPHLLRKSVVDSTGLHSLEALETGHRLKISNTGDPSDLDTVVRANWPQYAWTLTGSGGIEYESADTPGLVPASWTLVAPTGSPGTAAQPDFTNATNLRPRWWTTNGGAAAPVERCPILGFGAMRGSVPILNTDTLATTTGVETFIIQFDVWLDTFAWRQVAFDYGEDAYYAPFGLRATGGAYYTTGAVTTQAEAQGALTSPWVADEGFEILTIDATSYYTYVAAPRVSVGSVLITDQRAADLGVSSFGDTATIYVGSATSNANMTLLLKCVSYYNAPTPL